MSEQKRELPDAQRELVSKFLEPIDGCEDALEVAQAYDALDGEDGVLGDELEDKLLQSFDRLIAEDQKMNGYSWSEEEKAFADACLIAYASCVDLHRKSRAALDGHSKGMGLGTQRSFEELVRSEKQVINENRYIFTSTISQNIFNELTQQGVAGEAYNRGQATLFMKGILKSVIDACIESMKIPRPPILPSALGIGPDKFAERLDRTPKHHTDRLQEQERQGGRLCRE